MRCRGFSLIEVMAAVFVLGLLSLPLMNMVFTQSSESFRNRLYTRLQLHSQYLVEALAHQAHEKKTLHAVSQWATPDGCSHEIRQKRASGLGDGLVWVLLSVECKEKNRQVDNQLSILLPATTAGTVRSTNWWERGF